MSSSIRFNTSSFNHSELPQRLHLNLAPNLFTDLSDVKGNLCNRLICKLHFELTGQLLDPENYEGMEVKLNQLELSQETIIKIAEGVKLIFVSFEIQDHVIKLRHAVPALNGSLQQVEDIVDENRLFAYFRMKIQSLYEGIPNKIFNFNDICYLICGTMGYKNVKEYLDHYRNRIYEAIHKNLPIPNLETGLEPHQLEREVIHYQLHFMDKIHMELLKYAENVERATGIPQLYTLKDTASFIPFMSLEENAPEICHLKNNSDFQFLREIFFEANTELTSHYKTLESKYSLASSPWKRIIPEVPEADYEKAKKIILTKAQAHLLHGTITIEQYAQLTAFLQNAYAIEIAKEIFKAKQNLFNNLEQLVIYLFSSSEQKEYYLKFLWLSISLYSNKKLEDEGILRLENFEEINQLLTILLEIISTQKLNINNLNIAILEMTKMNISLSLPFKFLEETFRLITPQKSITDNFNSIDNQALFYIPSDLLKNMLSLDDFNFKVFYNAYLLTNGVELSSTPSDTNEEKTIETAEDRIIELPSSPHEDINTDFSEPKRLENIVESSQKIFTPQFYEQLQLLMMQAAINDKTAANESIRKMLQVPEYQHVVAGINALFAEEKHLYKNEKILVNLLFNSEHQRKFYLNFIRLSIIKYVMNQHNLVYPAVHFQRFNSLIEELLSNVKQDTNIDAILNILDANALNPPLYHFFREICTILKAKILIDKTEDMTRPTVFFPPKLRKIFSKAPLKFQFFCEVYLFQIKQYFKGTNLEAKVTKFLTCYLENKDLEESKIPEEMIKFDPNPTFTRTTPIINPVTGVVELKTGPKRDFLRMPKEIDWLADELYWTPIDILYEAAKNVKNHARSFGPSEDLHPWVREQYEASSSNPDVTTQEAAKNTDHHLSFDTSEDQDPFVKGHER